MLSSFQYARARKIDRSPPPSHHHRATADHRHPIANRSSTPAEPAATTCLTVADPGPYLGECGLGHNSLPCPTATVPSSWCSNPAYPDRATTVAWCTETFCNTCGYNFAPVYGGCPDGVQAAAPRCGECGHKSHGPCLHGELANNAKCRPRWNNEPRLSLKNDVGCMANHCVDCGNLNGKPCNNGDGEPICDAGLAPRKCVVRAPLRSTPSIASSFDLAVVFLRPPMMLAHARLLPPPFSPLLDRAASLRCRSSFR